jgi:hypothetical protein
MYTDDAILISQTGAAPAGPHTTGASQGAEDAGDDNGKSYAAKEVESEGDPAS